MIRIDAMIREDQYAFLNKLPGKLAENIREAIDLLIMKSNKETFKKSMSPSQIIKKLSK